MPECKELNRLIAVLESAVANLAQQTTLLLDLIRARDLHSWGQLDRQLELTLGEKERALGALRQHIRDHQCARGNFSDLVA